jgi:phosphate transport system permease protein
MLDVFTFALATIVVLSFETGRRRAVALIGRHGRRAHSRPVYHGLYMALWAGLPAAVVLVAWHLFEARFQASVLAANLPSEILALPVIELQAWIDDLQTVIRGGANPRAGDSAFAQAIEIYARARNLGLVGVGLAMLALATGGMAYTWPRISVTLRARTAVEKAVIWVLGAAASVAVLTTFGIVLSVLFEALRFFSIVSPIEFLFGLEWNPQMAIRADQVAADGAFGSVPLFLGTALISLIAMLVAGPIGLISAIYLSEYAAPGWRSVVKPLLEVLAGIPTVVYGVFAALTVAPLLRDAGSTVGLSVASESALAAGLVMGVMIIPFVSSLSDDVISAVPRSLREGSLALGATQSETIRRVVVPAALPGIVGALLLGVSRAIGETMIVVMAAGLAANLTLNPLDSVTTVTVQIATILVGDQEFDSPKTLAAFALGLVLLIVTLILNVVALRVVRKYREQYE